MIEMKYGLIVRDEQDKRLVATATHLEPRTGTRHNGVNPRFLSHCRALLRFYPGAFSIEVVLLAGRSPGVAVEDLPPVLWLEKSEELLGALSYRFPVEQVMQ